MSFKTIVSGAVIAVSFLLQIAVVVYSKEPKQGSYQTAGKNTSVEKQILDLNRRFQDKDFKACLEEAERLEKLAPDSYLLSRIKLLSLKSLRRNEQAISLSDQMLLKFPRQKEEILFDRLKVLSDLKKYDMCLADADALLAIQPTSEYAMRYKLFCLYNLGRYESTIDYAGMVLNKVPTAEGICRYLRGNAFYYSKNYLSALADYDRLIVTEPANKAPVDMKLHCLIKLNRMDQALSFVRTAVKKFPGDKSIGMNAILVLREKKCFQEALPLIDRLIAGFPEDHNLYVKKSEILVDCDRTREALKLISSRIEKARAGKNRNVLLAYLVNRAYIYRILMLNDEALRDLDEAIAVDPENGSLYSQKALIYSGEKRVDLVIKTMDKAIAINPRNPESYQTAGFLLMGTPGRFPQALEYYTKAVKFGAQHLTVYSHLAQIHESLGNYEEALANVKQAIARSGHDHFSEKMQLARLLSALGRYQEALKVYSELISQRREAHLYARKALIYGRLKQYGNAISSMSMAIRLNPSNFYYFKYRAGWRMKLKDYRLALADLDQALNIQPTGLSAYKMRIKLYNKTGEPDKARADEKMVASIHQKLEKKEFEMPSYSSKFF